MTKTILCDIDGTIADASARLHFIQQEPKDWDSFFDAVYTDKVRDDIRDILLPLFSQFDIVFVSGRPDSHREQTEKWLLDNLGDDKDWRLFMRKAGDYREDYEVKREIWERHLSHLDIGFVIDDRPQVIRMWQDLGIPVLDVGKQKEF